MAANDSGPLRHRYGSMRDLVVGTSVALSDGTLARSGGKVIKNVAGYDLGKLFTGSLGHARVDRAHRRATAPAAARDRQRGRRVSDDPQLLGDAARALAAQPLEADCLDVDWRDGAGTPAGALRQRRRERPGCGDGRADAPRSASPTAS